MDIKSPPNSKAQTVKFKVEIANFAGKGFKVRMTFSMLPPFRDSLAKVEDSDQN